MVDKAKRIAVCEASPPGETPICKGRGACCRVINAVFGIPFVLVGSV